MISVIAIDDDPVARFGVVKGELRRCNDIKVVATGDNGSDALPLYRQHHKSNPVILLDLNMPRNGILAAEDIFRFYPKAKIVIYSSEVDNVSLPLLKRIGILGFVKKGPSSKDVPTAIRCAAENENFYCMESAIIDSNKEKIGKLFDELTPQERKIIYLLAFNMSVDNIAKVMCRDAKTIYTHKHNAFNKLDINSIGELLFLARKNNIYN